MSGHSAAEMDDSQELPELPVSLAHHDANTEQEGEILVLITVFANWV